MVLKIEISDFFYGFIRNYWTFGIRYESKNAKWTHKILGYFAQLGDTLGFFVEYEWKRYDLAWFKTLHDQVIEGQPFLHVEHENSSSRLSNLLEKVEESGAPSVIAIGYPASAAAHKSFVKRIEKLHKKLDKEFMFILDPAYYAKEDESSIVGYVSRPRLTYMQELEAERYEAPDGTYYATWLDLRVELDEEE